jgi:hypothetical protein
VLKFAFTGRKPLHETVENHYGEGAYMALLIEKDPNLAAIIDPKTSRNLQNDPNPVVEAILLPGGSVTISLCIENSWEAPLDLTVSADQEWLDPRTRTLSLMGGETGECHLIVQAKGKDEFANLCFSWKGARETHQEYVLVWRKTTNVDFPEPGKTPEQLRKMLLQEPHNFPLREQYLRIRTPDQEKSDYARARWGLTICKSAYRLTGLTFLGGLGGGLGYALFSSTGKGQTEMGRLDLGMAVGAGTDLVAGSGFAVLAAFGIVLFEEWLAEREEEKETEKLESGTAGILGRAFDLVGGMVSGLVLGIASGIFMGITSAFGGDWALSLGGNLGFILGGCSGGVILGGFSSFSILLGIRMKGLWDLWTRLGPLPSNGYSLSLDRAWNKFSGNNRN